MENEDFYEEVSEQEVEFGQEEEVVGFVAPMPVNITLDVQVVPGNPESPPPSPLSRSPKVPSPPQWPL